MGPAKAATSNRRAPLKVGRLLVAALAQAGRLDEAQRELERLKNFQPDISLAWIEKNVPYTPGPMKSYLEGWRKVGLQ